MDTLEYGYYYVIPGLLGDGVCLDLCERFAPLEDQWDLFEDAESVLLTYPYEEERLYVMKVRAHHDVWYDYEFGHQSAIEYAVEEVFVPLASDYPKQLCKWESKPLFPAEIDWRSLLYRQIYQDLLPIWLSDLENLYKAMIKMRDEDQVQERFLNLLQTSINESWSILQSERVLLEENRDRELHWYEEKCEFLGIECINTFNLIEWTKRKIVCV